MTDSSAFMRSAVELLARAVEKSQLDADRARDYTDWAAADAEGEEFRAGARDLMAERFAE
jgi:hypothetical protein